MRVVILALAIAAAPMAGNGAPASLAQAEGRAVEIVTGARQAVGGEEHLAGITTLAVEGSFRRLLGSRDIEGTLVLTLGVPDRIRHEEEVAFPGGGGLTRLAGMNGDHVWEDSTTRGGGPGMMIRLGGPDGAREPDPEARQQMQRQRLSAIYQRMTLALLATGEGLAYVGVADTGAGTADVLETRDARGQPVRLFVSQESHLPVGVSYMEVRPRMMMGGPGGTGAGPGGRARGGPPPDPEEMRRRMETMEPPAPSSVVMRLEDHRSVNGLMLPHLVVLAVDGEPVEEWTIRRYQVNPQLDPAVFDRK